MTKRDEGYIWPEIEAERVRQDEMHPGTTQIPDGPVVEARRTYERIAKLGCDRAAREGRLTYRDVFEEEVAEVLAAEPVAKLRQELVQVAAVSVKWIAEIDRREEAEKIEGLIAAANNPRCALARGGGRTACAAFHKGKPERWCLNCAPGEGEGQR